jgi:hypothetical protein
MMRQLLVFGIKTFKITIPDDARVTFGPWSPPRKDNPDRYSDDSKKGTLRIYKGSERSGNVLAVFTHVTGFRDLSIAYAEEVAREEGAVIWKDDQNGYQREEKVTRQREWLEPEVPMLSPPAERVKGKRRA